jgi:hypothetical protein
MMSAEHKLNAASNARDGVLRESACGHIRLMVKQNDLVM